jgi:hypothetical protein
MVMSGAVNISLEASATAKDVARTQSALSTQHSVTELRPGPEKRHFVRHLLAG